MSDEQDKGGAGGADLTAELRTLIASLKKGEAGVSDTLSKLVDRVIGQNAKYREKIRQLEAQPKVGEGQILLDGDEAKAWKVFRELGDPKDVRRALDQGRQAATELGEIRRAEVYQRAAKLVGYRPPIFAKYAKADNLDIVIEPHPKEKDGDGKPRMVPYVKGEGDQKTALGDYAGEHWADDLDLLKEGEVRAGTPPPGRRAAMPPPTGDEPDELRQDMLRAGVGAF
jgi:hypothetical protein